MYVTLNRPEVKNAMNFAMVDALMDAFEMAEADDSVRVIVMRGANGIFCAGGDLKDFSAGHKNADDIAIGNRRFGTLLERAQRFPKLLVTFVRGAAMGGGFGLVCVSDVAIAEDNCAFGMPEVTLGLIPAQIAPFVCARMGLTETRRMALTGDIMTGKKARKVGLVHYSEPTVEAMDHRLMDVIKQALRAAPGAVATTKRLLMDMGDTVTPETLGHASKLFARSLQGEGAEGTRAFVEKRPASWMEGDE